MKTHPLLPLALAPLLATASSAQQATRPAQPAAPTLRHATLDLATGSLTVGPPVQHRGAAAYGTAVTLDVLESPGFGPTAVPMGTAWFSKLDKGTGGTGGESEVMTSFRWAYRTTALDTSLGGPGASARITFHEGYTGPSGGVGSAPTGTPLAVFDLSGLPGAFGAFPAAYLLQTNVATPLPGGGFSGGQALPDGDLGWSFTFVDQDPSTLLAATLPLLGCLGSCTGPAYGLEEYRPAGSFFERPFGPSSPVSVALQVCEAQRVSSASVVDNGSGLNPLILATGSGPALGSPWSVTLDCSGAAPGKPAIFELSFGPGVSMPSPWGELLVSTGPGPSFVLPHGGGVVELGPIPLPVDLTYLGAAYRLQGLCADVPRGYLSNALVQTVGSH